MKTAFNNVSATPGEAEQALKTWSIKYEKQADGSLLVPGNLDISGKGLTVLPDLSQLKVNGNFSCSDNQLTSLEGAPQTVGGGFNCSYNQLTTLEYAPQTVGGGFYCSNNQLMSLEHAPPSVGGGFSCHGNRLASLKHAPQTFQKLWSDFGEFSSWNGVPETLRTSPETKARLEQERQAQMDRVVHAATVLQAPLKARPPLRVRTGFRP